ncbi:carbon-phosphorus lyase complex subunit PhnI [Actinopolymorpha pittospori]|uniref:Alpha-D-ribose 1-methylphosphonate 5-triphosphate synthase subunit PhnI n=1 Tax=Actinopolymorpha pittospori TaxID=648752 RepID=A0A927RA60_9ACTN|nr:carbon-phosphorus lyase complex subunit PhnI [Actinopolymorpha pittospori]MBE1607264.1 alpha-D-ribose 1-methylphosphonate 5-triphosphate synthase subunit PhnI [Actinopolymorpha pittospori]
MGYSGARGGLDAIRAAEALVRRRRLTGESDWLGLDQITERLRLAVDRVQGEGGLWAPELAARAFRQAEGDVLEAAQLLRAYRSTLPRLAYTVPVDADEMVLLRRIVPAYRTPPGPQLLGRTLDYTGRLIDLTPEADARAEAHRDQARRAEDSADTGSQASVDTAAPDSAADEQVDHRRPPRLLELLRSLDLAVERRTGEDPEPFDITRKPARPGAPRSAWLAAMSRAETGALMNLWYRNVLGPDGYIHEVTLGEVRHGYLPVRIAHPHTGGSVDIGTVRATETEAIEDLDGLDEDRTKFDVGYGLCFGHNERKAIAMANLDISAWRDRGRSALHQSILLTTDGLDSSGFLEHLKLPHYVTFRSMVERKRAVAAALAEMDRREAAQADVDGLLAEAPPEEDCISSVSAGPGADDPVSASTGGTP